MKCDVCTLLIKLLHKLRTAGEYNGTPQNIHNEECSFHCMRTNRISPIYKYGTKYLQVGGVSNETVKYGREFCGTWTQE
jgi:hypothetical protein